MCRQARLCLLWISHSLKAAYNLYYDYISQAFLFMLTNSIALNRYFWEIRIDQPECIPAIPVIDVTVRLPWNCKVTSPGSLADW